MTEYTCAIDGCESPAHARGWCDKHYARWLRHGDPRGGGRRHSTPEEAFAARTERRGKCLVWTGAKGSTGYGRLQVNGRSTQAHRYAYEEAYGPIPDGMTIDHICYNRTCVDVAHLRLATRQQNSSNRAGANVRSSTGVRGVYPYGSRFGVEIQSRWYGTFDSIEEASRVAARERARLFGEFAGRG